jgi:hypothetical protein
MDGDGSITPPGTPGGQGADPTDAPGAYDSPVNTVPLWNANAVVPGAPRVDREIATHVRDDQSNLNVLPPRDDTRRVLSFPGGAGLLQFGEEILEDQKALTQEKLTQEKRKNHEDGKRELKKFRDSEGGFDNTSPPSPAPHEFVSHCDTHDRYFVTAWGCPSCNDVLENALDSDNEDRMLGSGDSLASFSHSEDASEGDDESDNGSDDSDWDLEISDHVYSDAEGEDGF